MLLSSLKRPAQYYATVVFFLVLLMTGGGASASHSRKLLAAQSQGGSDGEEDSENSGTAGEVYDEEKLAIWRQSIVDVIEHKLSGMCSAMIRAVKNEDQTPGTACSQLRSNKLLMRISCTQADVGFMEEAVCGYSSIVLPTEAVSSSPGATLMPSPLASPASPLSSASASSKTSAVAASPSSLLSSSVATTSSSRTVETVHKDSITDDHQSSFPSHDSRLSDKCNQVLPHLAQALEADKENSGSGCLHLHHLAELSHSEGAAVAEDTKPEMTIPGVKVLVSACTRDDLHLLHGLLCAHQDRAGPEHALHGEQQKRVNYVIKTELTSSCRDALSPLGEGRMKEDVQDSCLTLRGVEGNQLVTNQVCTRRDLDNLLDAVCDSAPGLAWFQPSLTFLLIFVYIFTHQVTKVFLFRWD